MYRPGSRRQSFMDIDEALERLRILAESDSILRDRLIETKNSDAPISDFCRTAASAGIPVDMMDLVFAGEEMYAAMRRSTNGGGENSPALKGEEDYYSMFIAGLERLKGQAR